MNTVVTNQMAIVPEARQVYTDRKKILNSEPPRFDLMMKDIKKEDNKKKYRG
jgi:hypothetical protein